MTLQIVKALIEKTPRDLSLYASAVLRMFRTILRSNDVTMIEETVPTWEAFCTHQDPAQLAADQEFIQQYDEIVELYAGFASKDTPIQVKGAKSIPLLIRYRKAGLDAIRAMCSSEILTAETGRQLHAIIPVLLENVYSDNGRFLDLLSQREEEQLEMEKELALKRRQSISTVRTTDTGEGDAVAASGTTEAADKLAEQEAGVIALQAIKSIFTRSPRGQLRLVATEVLRWIRMRVKPNDHFPHTSKTLLVAGSWPCTLFSLICGWSPVQDRYIILVTAMDTLIRSPIVEDDLEKQYVLAVIIGWLLSSDINFIGLSVMDVLVGLMQHILLLLQLGGSGTNVLPHPQQADSREMLDSSQQSSPTGVPVVMEISQSPSTARLQLLNQLQRCIGALAVHVYYTDQISDMISAILSRLKPSAIPQIPDTASAIENPIDTANALASSVNLSEKPGVDGFFSFETARESALHGVGEIIAWANSTRSDGSSTSTTRSPLDVDRWEGTQWLLRDPAWKVRSVYVEALLAWMKYELKKRDLRVPEESPAKKSKPQKKESGAKDSSLARRAVSNASQRDNSPKRKRHTFLQLLHLAIYDNAVQYAEYEADILLLHLLLAQLVLKLGVNAAQHGLPMIFRLQECILEVDSPTAKINIGSLVHGYLWALSVHFNFENTSTGRDIHNEIARRVNHNVWLKSVRIPPLSLDQIDESFDRQQPRPTGATVEKETIKPFDKRESIIEKISEGYTITLYSPPASPPGSPSRSFSQPMLAQVARTPSFSAPRPVKNNTMPAMMKEALMTEWTKEAVIAATTRSDGSRSGSLHGSASPTTATHSTSRHLTVGVAAANGSANGDGMPSPRKPHPHSHTHSARPASGTYGFVPQNYGPGFAMREALGGHGRPQSRKSRRASQSPTPYSTTSSVRDTLRVDDLKRVLAGAQLEQIHHHADDTTRAEADSEETGSESMVSYEGSEMSFMPPVADARSSAAIPASNHTEPDPQDAYLEPESARSDAITEGTITPRPLTAVSALSKKPSADNLKRKASITSQENDDIPPVPPLPANLRSPTPSGAQTNSSTALAPDRMASTASKKAQSLRSLGSQRERDRPRTSGSMASKGNRYSAMTTSSKAWNVRDLLDDIDADSPGALGSGSRGTGALGGRPPY